MELTTLLQNVDVENQFDNNTNVTDNSECSICKETMVNTERYISSCNHTYHYNCINHHKITLNATCPLCRKDIKLNTSILKTKTKKSCLNEFFGVNIQNFYVTSFIMYEFIIMIASLFNLCVIFVTFAGLVKFKFQVLVKNYFITSLIFGTIQSLTNLRLRVMLEEHYKTHQQSEIFGKREVTILQIIWFILYLAQLMYTVYVFDNKVISGTASLYLDILMVSNISRFVISVLKMLIYVFDIYAIYERHVGYLSGLYVFLTVHS